MKASLRQKLMDMAKERGDFLTSAETALKEGRQEDYDAAYEKVTNLNGEMSRIQALIQEQDRKALEGPAPGAAEVRDMAEERGALLMKGEPVTFSVNEIRRAVMNETTVTTPTGTTLATGTLVEPTGAGSNIRDPLGNGVSSIVDQVYVQDLTGMGAFMEPYVISELEANSGKVETLAGTARAQSVDPAFGIAEIKPIELNVTTFVDRNISRLSPANYYDKISGMAMRAMRRRLAGFIVNGDNETSHVMHGIKTALNKAGKTIYATQNVSGVDVDLLDTLYFAYGSSSEMGPRARLLLTKQDLKALGALRGTNEKRRLLEITPDAGNPNTGTIRDGGMVLSYTICPDLTSLAGAAAGSTDLQTMLYGDPMNYELGLFGGYTVRVDESVKAVERMVAILGDAMVGGNLIVDKGFVVATVPKSSGAAG